MMRMVVVMVMVVTMMVMVNEVTLLVSTIIIISWHLFRVLQTQEKRIHFHLYLAMLIQVGSLINLIGVWAFADSQKWNSFLNGEMTPPLPPIPNFQCLSFSWNKEVPLQMSTWGCHEGQIPSSSGLPRDLFTKLDFIHGTHLLVIPPLELKLFPRIPSCGPFKLFIHGAHLPTTWS